jgi:hypothetical protein
LKNRCPFCYGQSSRLPYMAYGLSHIKQHDMFTQALLSLLVEGRIVASGKNRYELTDSDTPSNK